MSSRPTEQEIIPISQGGNRGITTTVTYTRPLIARIGLDVTHQRDSFSHGRLIPDFNAQGRYT